MSSPPGTAIRRAAAITALASLALGAFTAIYRGPFWRFFRGYVGDVAAAALVFALVSLAWPHRRGVRVAITAAICLTVEIAQALRAPPQSTAAELLLGGHLDPWDLLAYAIGIALAAVWEHRRGRTRR